MINSSHSYERLDWNHSTFRPIYSHYTNNVIKEEIIKDVSDCDVNNSLDDLETGRQGNLVTLSPLEIPTAQINTHKQELCNNIPGQYSEPHNHIKNQFEKINKFPFTPNSYFITFTVPPDTKVKIRNKEYKYFLLKIVDQLRYLKNLIYRTLNEEKTIKDYIITFEITAKGIVHSHCIFDCPVNHPSSVRNIYSTLLNIKTLKKAEINCNFGKCDRSVAFYICKIETIENDNTNDNEYVTNNFSVADFKNKTINLFKHK